MLHSFFHPDPIITSCPETVASSIQLPRHSILLSVLCAVHIHRNLCTSRDDMYPTLALVQMNGVMDGDWQAEVPVRTGSVA